MKNLCGDVPALPGVYLFKDAAGVPIYIGKAKSLKKRVSSYFNRSANSWKGDILRAEAASCEHRVTKTETEALILEAELIRAYQPRFNMLLKDGQPFVFIMISRGDLPQLKLVRNKKEQGVYFGPFIYKGQARSVYRYLLEKFQLFLCGKKLENGCLQYHMGRCAGSCTESFDKADYLFRLSLAQKMLQGKTGKLERELDARIKQCSRELAFEQAQKLVIIRKNIQAIVATIKLKMAARPEVIPLMPVRNTHLVQLLGLEAEPRMIDCFDISHFQSCGLVGSCVRFIDGVPAKSFFRHFVIKSLTKQDDCAALQEIVQRRYKKSEDIPDLILIDGGKGQLRAVQKVAPAGMPVISLAKREETIFFAYKSGSLILDRATAEGRLLLSLRDYAHHFALSYHRSKRVLGSVPFKFD